MQKKDDKVDNKTAYKEDRQREKKRAREKYRGRFAKKVHSLKSKYWRVCMTREAKNTCVIGHFRVPKPLTFKMRPSAQPFL